jgi:hypothetical protein
LQCFDKALFGSSLDEQGEGVEDNARDCNRHHQCQSHSITGTVAKINIGVQNKLTVIFFFFSPS